MRSHELRSLTVRVLKTVVRHRTSGHAAEIAFFALLSLVPATVTLGGVLHLLAHVGGPQLAARGEEGATQAIRFLIGPKFADTVVNPFVEAQLSHSRGLAITGLLLTAWLTSRAFHALSHALDVAFGVVDRRPSRVQRLIALGYAVCAVAVVAVTLAVMVLGWRSGRTGIDRFFGRAPVIAQLWAVLRWPLLVGILLGIVIGLYRFGPNVSHRCRDCLPGACVAVVLWIAAAVGFRAYLLLGSAAPTGVSTHDARVTLIGRAVGASIATAVWMYVSALAVLTGAELNGVLGSSRRDAARPDPQVAAVLDSAAPTSIRSGG
jgi:membrane protein